MPFHLRTDVTGGGPRLRLLDPATPGPALIAFGVSRVIFGAMGVSFVDTWIDRGWQYIDPTLLEANPLHAFESHTQPPLLNFVLGVLYKVVPFGPGETMFVLYLGLGMVMTVALLTIARSLGATPRTATAIAVAVMVSPAVVLFEHTSLYDYPGAVGLTVAAACLARGRSGHRPRWFAGYVATVTALVLSRPLLHPLWGIAAVAVGWWALAPAWRNAPAAGPRANRHAGAVIAASGLVVGSLLVVNTARFGNYGLSSWFGMNVAHVAVDQLPADTRRALIATGDLGPVANVNAFHPYADYEPFVGPCVAQPGDDPVLADPVKPNGEPNFNARCYLPLYAEELGNAWTAARREPAYTAGSMVSGAELFAVPASRYVYVSANRRALGPWADVMDLVFVPVPLPLVHPLPQVEGLESPDARPRVGLSWFLILGAVMGLGARSARRWRRGEPARVARDIDVLQVFVGGTVGFVVVVANIAEVGENMRLRFLVEPLALVVVAAALVRWIDARRTRHPGP